MGRASAPTSEYESHKQGSSTDSQRDAPASVPPDGRPGRALQALRAPLLL